MSEIERDGAPHAGESGDGREPLPAAESAAEHQEQVALGESAAESEATDPAMAPVEPDFGWDQPQPARGRRRKRVVAAAGAAAAVIIAAVVAAVVVPKSSSPHAGPQLTAAQVVTIASRNAARLNSMSATLTEQVSGQTSATVTATAIERRKPLLLSMNATLSDAGNNIPLSEIITADTIYLRFNKSLPGTPKALEHKWIKIPLNQLGAASFLAALMRSVQNENPTSQTQLLVAAEHLRAIGTESIGGVPTTKYAGWFKPSAALKHLAPSLRTALAPPLKLITGNVNLTVWIDGQHQIRKLTEVEQMASGITITVVCTFSQFNQPVNITLPTGNQVVTPPAGALSG